MIHELLGRADFMGSFHILRAFMKILAEIF